ncbi:MAG: trypsin-like serine protease [Alphaproteobacteria bacterium]|nr:trypsin-like serine protease [Alphaproteobacteria bacterium]
MVVLAVIGGTPLPTALGPVVALLDGDDRVSCSGVLVGERHVLTAAHCADATAVAWGTDLRNEAPDEVRAITGVELPDDHVPGEHGSDLAVLELVSAAPAPSWPVATRTVAPGDRVSIYGFGVTGELLDDAGLKQGATLEVLDVGPDTFLSWSPDANACSGDSGGPAVADGGEGAWVVGVNTWVDPACLGGKTGTTRIDQRLDWLGAVVPDLVTEPLRPSLDTEPRGGCSHVPGGGAWMSLVGIWMRRKSRS